MIIDCNSGGGAVSGFDKIRELCVSYRIFGGQAKTILQNSARDKSKRIKL